MQAMVLAAGSGTRLRPLTLFTAKSMVPICGRPLLEWILIWLSRHRIKEVAINLHYLPDQITDHFGAGPKFDIDITYSFEQDLLGTAGAVKRLEGYWHGPFIVVYGDVLTDMKLSPFIDFHFAHPDAKVTIAVHRIRNRMDVGLLDVDVDQRVLQFIEKPTTNKRLPNLVNAGIMIIDPEILQFIPTGETCDFGLNLLPRLIDERVAVFAWPIPEETLLIDVGSPERYALAQKLWTRHMNKFL